MNSHNSLSILLTGTISPQNVPNLKRNNFLEREQDYYKAIKKWQALGIPIVFCENSNYESELINSLFTSKEHCEYLKFETKTSQFGKGKGEAEIFEYAFQNSEILKNSSLVCKVTGRYFVKNQKNIFSKISNLNFEICANFTLNLTWVDSRFFFFTPNFYSDFLKHSLLNLDESTAIHFESCLSNSVHNAISKGKKFELLPVLPMYEGYYGTLNTQYKNSFFATIKYIIYSKMKWYFFNNGT